MIAALVPWSVVFKILEFLSKHKNVIADGRREIVQVFGVGQVELRIRRMGCQIAVFPQFLARFIQARVDDTPFV
jgi:hypothetical protein